MTAIPSVLRLDEKPECIPAYRRICEAQATSQNPYASGSVIKIPIDTAFSGALTDPQQTRLQATVTIINRNPMIDFLKLPKCGWNILFKEMKWMVNGGPLEPISDYALKFEDMLEKTGLNQEPYEIFRSNLYDPSGGHELHQNLIKPSMVDARGCPMYRSEMFYDSQRQDRLYFGLASQIALNSQANIPTNLTATGSSVGMYVSDVTNAGAPLFLHPNVKYYGGAYENVPVSYVAVDNTRVLNLSDYTDYSRRYCEFGTNISEPTRLKIAKAAGERTIYTPAEWPYGQPILPHKPTSFSHSRWQDILAYMSNCTNIPIGMRPNLSYADFCQNVTAFSASTNETRTSFRFSTPVLSGLWGLYAEKFFPEMLIAAGKCWLEITLHPPEYALQVLMDPCRRVPGTIRDFAPYTGTLNNQPRYPRSRTIGASTTLPADDPFGDTTSSTSNPIRSNQPHPYLGKYAVHNYMMPAALGLAGLGGSFLVGGSERTTTEDHRYAFYTGVYSKETCLGTRSMEPFLPPVPQYSLHATVWQRKSCSDDMTQYLALKNSYVNESTACYGTYLRHAVAQTRRCIVDNSGTRYSDYSIDYELTSIVLRTEQIIVPSEIAAQLTAGSRSGAISYHTTFINSSYNNAPTTVNQNLLLTVSGASVNNITFLFQSNVQLSGNDALQYNSVASYNPWCKMDFQKTANNDDTLVYNVGGQYTITNPLENTQALGLNLQLKIGNELFPRLPLNNIPSIMDETQKGFQTIADYGVKLPLQTYFTSTFSTNSTEQNLQYDILNGGFFGVFVPVSALDDQTCTGNPYLNIIGAARAGSTPTRISALRCPPAELSTNGYQTSYNGVLNLFQPQDSNFRLCFNLDTFLHQNTSARCGIPIVNNQLFLQGDKMNFMSHKVDSAVPSVRVTAIYYQDAKVSFEDGGNAYSYY